MSCDPCSYSNLVPFSAGVPGDSSGLIPLASPEAMVLTGPARLEGLPWAAAGLVRSKCTGAVELPERCHAGSPATHHTRQFEEEPRMKNKGGFLAAARAPVLVLAISPALQLQELMV